MEKLNNSNLVEFETKWFDKNQPKSSYRFGQAICNEFILPKEVEDLLFYEESVEICRNVAWQYVLGTLEF
jgi:hypothetical protein